MLCYAMLGFPPFNALAVKKYLGINIAPLAQRDPPQLQGFIIVDLALLSRNMLICSRYPYFAIYYNRPILVLSLDCRQGCKKLSKKERRLSYEEGVHNFGYCPLCLSEGFRQTSKLAHFPGPSRRPRRPAS